MPTTLVNTAGVGEEKVKMRWNEPYVTEGLNKKFNGVVPGGIIQAGILETNANGYEVKINADPTTGEVVVSYVDGNNYQTTINFGAGNVIVNMATAVPNVVYLCLYVEYVTGADTIVEWRAYSESELFGVTPVAEAGEVVIFGKVDTSGGSPLAAAAVTSEHRRDAWKAVSTGLLPWRPMLANGGFEQKWAAWTVVDGTHIPVILSSSAHDSNFCADATGDGAGTGQVLLAQQVGTPVIPGELIRIRADISDSSWDGSGGFSGMILWFGDKDFSPIGSGDEAMSFVTGVSGWTELEAFHVVPPTAAYLYFVWIKLDQTATNVGTLKIDNVQVYRQQIGADQLFPPNNNSLAYVSARGITLAKDPPADHEDRNNWQITPNVPGTKLQIAHSGSADNPVEFTAQTPVEVAYNHPADVAPAIGHIGLANVCQAWIKINLDGVGIPFIEDAYNISTVGGTGVTRESNGVFKVNLLDGFPNNNYVVHIDAYMGLSTKPITSVVSEQLFDSFEFTLWEWNSGTNDWDLTSNADVNILITVYGRRT